MKIAALLMIACGCLAGTTWAQTTDQACSQYSKLAYAMASDRQSGTTLAAQLAGIRERVKNPILASEFRDLANFLYTSPAGKFLSPEGAMSSMYADCSIRIEKNSAGSRSYSTTDSVALTLRDFKTFNGKPIVALLAGYGLRIASIEVTPAEYYKNPKDKAGDKILLMTLANRPTKTMPCRLNAWISGQILPMPEFIQRPPKIFPLIRADEDDPLIYWASTGKCSDAYAY